MSFLPIDRSSYRKRTLLENLARLGGDAPLMYEEEQPPIQDPNVPMGQSGFEATGQSEPAEVPHLYFDPQKAWDAEQPEEVQRGTRLSEAYKPQTTANDRFEALLNNYPERDKPSFMRKLSASLVGFGGDAKGAQAIIDRPFNRKRDVWEDQTKGAYQAANLERYENVNQRYLLNSEERQRQFDEREERLRQKDTDTNNYRNRMIKIREQVATDTGSKVLQDRDGNLIHVKRDGSQKYITDDNGKPIKGKDLTYEDRVNLLNAGHTNILARQENAARLGLFEGSPNEHKQGIVNRAMEFRQRHPAYAGWVDIDDDTGEVTIDQPRDENSIWPSGPTKEQYDAMMQAIYGSGNPVQSGRGVTDPNSVKVTQGVDTKPPTTAPSKGIAPGTPASRLNESQKRSSQPDPTQSNWIWDSIKGLGKMQPEGFGSVGAPGTVGSGNVPPIKPGGTITPGGKAGKALPVQNPDDRVTVMSPDHSDINGGKISLPREQLDAFLAKHPQAKLVME